VEIKRIGWLGLGRIGLPMASRVAAAGFRVVGFDISPERVVLARKRGVEPAPEVGTAVAEADAVFTSMPTDKVLLAAALGRDGFLAAMRPEAILVETSTTAPATSARLAEAARERGIDYLRTPVSGSTELAEAGTLTMFVSGPRAAVERVRSALAAFTRTQLWVGEDEQARYAKLAVNLMVMVTAGAMGEALAFGRKGGLAWPVLLDAIAESVAGSPLVKYKTDWLKRRDFTAAASNLLIAKDLELLVDGAREMGVPVPLAEHVQGLYRKMIEKGLGEEDFFSVIKINEEQAGLGEP
jgi:3-hydroxyisobutyrate dehydrogenase-like beta-hydroxyacid dehydrogenase